MLGGAPALVDALRRELLRGGDPSAIRDASLGALDGAAALVYVLAGEPTEEDERALRSAATAGVPIIAAAARTRRRRFRTCSRPTSPRCSRARGSRSRTSAGVWRRRLGDAAAPLAARLPALRPGIVEALVAKVAKQNGLIGAAVFIPGVDFPVLTLNQLRLVMRIATAYGQRARRAARCRRSSASSDRASAFRTIARGALGVVPVGGWAVKGGVAYTGTRALGEAAIRYFEATRRRGGAGCACARIARRRWLSRAQAQGSTSLYRSSD